MIDGPPGTGKTQTILNLVANIVTVPGQRVGIVSFNNAAVENVRDKLAEEGYGHMVADLGRKEKIAEFFARQEARNAAVDEFVGQSPAEAPPPAEYVAELDSRLQTLQGTARQLAMWKQELDATSSRGVISCSRPIPVSCPHWKASRYCVLRPLGSSNSWPIPHSCLSSPDRSENFSAA